MKYLDMLKKTEAEKTNSVKLTMETHIVIKAPYPGFLLKFKDFYDNKKFPCYIYDIISGVEIIRISAKENTACMRLKNGIGSANDDVMGTARALVFYVESN